MNDFKKNLLEKLPELKRHAMIESAKYLKYSEMDADDLLNETVKKALKKQHKFDVKYFLAYLKKIMTKLSIHEYIKNSIKVELKGEELKDAQASGKKTYKMKKRAENYGKVAREVARDDDEDEDEMQSLDDIKLNSPSAQELSSSLNQKEEKEYEILEKDEKAKKLYNSISKLSEKCQEIFHLYMVVEGSFLELSKRMNIPLGTVQSRFHRCKEKLLKIILKESPGEANEI